MNKETGREILNRLANTESSSESDSGFMQMVLHKLGFNNAIVTSGIVYIDGKGTLENPPMDIHSYAKALIIGVQ